MRQSPCPSGRVASTHVGSATLRHVHCGSRERGVGSFANTVCDEAVLHPGTAQVVRTEHGAVQARIWHSRYSYNMQRMIRRRVGIDDGDLGPLRGNDPCRVRKSESLESAGVSGVFHNT